MDRHDLQNAFRELGKQTVEPDHCIAEYVMHVVEVFFVCDLVRLDVLALILPLVIGLSNWTGHDQSANHVGEQFATLVFSKLPPNAVLLTYWDALTNLTYAHCVEGQRPDISLRAYDVAARVVCDPVTGSLDDVARDRPVFALFVFDGDVGPLRRSFDLVAGPRLPLPYGNRGLDQGGTLYRLVLK